MLQLHEERNGHFREALENQRRRNDLEQERNLILRSMLNLCHVMVAFWILSYLAENGYFCIPDFVKKGPKPSAWTLVSSRLLVFLRIRQPEVPAWYSLTGLKSVLPYLFTFTFSPLGMTFRFVSLYFAGCFSYGTFLCNNTEGSLSKESRSAFNSFWLAVSCFPFISLLLPVYAGFIPFMMSFLMITLFFLHATLLLRGAKPSSYSLQQSIFIYLISTPTLSLFYYLFTS